MFELPLYPFFESTYLMVTSEVVFDFSDITNLIFPLKLQLFM